jgi:hypothetical protein
MSVDSIKDKIINQLDQLSPQLLDTVDDFVAFLLTRSSSSAVEASTEMTAETAAEIADEKTVTPIEEDPIVGLIKGTPDLATN